MTKKQFKLNLPNDVKDWLEHQSEKNLRSMSNEIILAIKEKMEREAAAQK
ncbi:hypothetical protein MACH17_18700 [Phaeobacter inhibens]|nr:Arc family DNA-binding protein [Phaeobacter inhibens]GLO70353.1 hypothetical protein MACH17_18700 [Phaeobacter inhibens]